MNMTWIWHEYAARTDDERDKKKCRQNRAVGQKTYQIIMVCISNDALWQLYKNSDRCGDK